MNLILVFSGLLSLALCGALVFTAVPRAGKPTSALVRTEARAMAAGIAVLVLLFTGLTLLLKGLL